MGGLLHLVQRGGAWARAAVLPNTLLAVPNVTAHASTAYVYQSLYCPLLCGFNVAIKELKRRRCIHFANMEVTQIDSSVKHEELIGK